MPTLVQFGAGNIGRGFIAPTFAAAGWSVVFVDVDAVRIDALRSRGAYAVREVDAAGEREVRVALVTGIRAADEAAVTLALSSCDLAATAVGLNVLERVGAPIARGLAARLAAGGRGALDVLVCENGAGATGLLRRAVLAALPEAGREAASARLGLVRTSIGRMIPAATGSDPLDIAVEPYACLPVERAAFVGTVPVVPHLDARYDFELVLRQKLYLHNLTHACLAYAGHLRGLVTIRDCVIDPAIAGAARTAGREAGEALARAHGPDEAGRAAIRADCARLLDDLFMRYANPALADPVARVARDPLRKLAADDRLVGAARLCIQQGVPPTAIIGHVLLACAYTPAADEPGAERWLRLRSSSVVAQIAAATALPPEDPFMTAIDKATATRPASGGSSGGTTMGTRRAAAAQAMRSAGIVLTDAEAAGIEIADFGLGRFEQFGLAIQVYVNTERCCAKELVMLPGQICPEHRHPSIPGPSGASEPGKEETFRVRGGEVHLFLPGNTKDGAERAFALKLVPEDKHAAMTVFKHVHLKPGDQYTLKPNTPHWFVGGPTGAIVSEFSTRSRDEADIFTDSAIKRVPDPA